MDRGDKARGRVASAPRPHIYIYDEAAKNVARQLDSTRMDLE